MKKVLIPLFSAAVASSLFATGITVESANEMGILEVKSPLSNTIVSVPFSAFGIDAGNITASNLVKTANLTTGDKLVVFAKGADNYKAWELDANGNWAGVYSATIDANGQPSIGTTPSADSITLASGEGFWLYRQNPTSSNGSITNSFFLFGQPTTATSATLSAGLNLVAPPSATGAVYDLKHLTGMTSGDSVIIPTDAVRTTYTYDGAAWGYNAKVWEERNGVGSYKNHRVTPENISIVPGTGFWYNSTASKTIVW